MNGKCVNMRERERVGWEGASERETETETQRDRKRGERLRNRQKRRKIESVWIRQIDKERTDIEDGERGKIREY